MKKTLLILLFVLMVFPLISQNETSVEKSYVKINLKYSSDYVFMGRTDSLAAPYLSPSISYYHKSGFYTRGSLSYLTTADQNRIDLSIVSLGYDATSKNLYGGIGLSAYFFNQESYAVPSSLFGFLDAYLGYDFYWFEINTDLSLGMSDNMDVFTGIEVFRIFYLFDSKLLITPSFYTNAATQNYYNEYYNTRNSKMTLGGGFTKGKGANGNINNVNNVQESVTLEEASKFQVLDYEFSNSATYRLKNWRINATAKFFIPVNASTVTADGETVYEEELNNVFFYSFGIGYIIK
ncbi:hypothetical protein QYS48_19710 [Marivirga arenosa]|uniref:Outer membrane beta-barrel protein n=1 Tax=Marivirga arenosa TaxID=3059076 RepID=A0AA49JI01_9BACT|nr:hypothetical protein [Marivirga sp. ABR2-2]WKK84385.2 hypothetical protein QYS48_19710 [Marivirga sp. ABR2-2]